MRTRIKFIPQEIWKVTGTPKNGICEMEIIGDNEVIIKLKKKAAIDSSLTAIIKPDNGQFMAYCPELDLVSAMDSGEEAFKDLVEMANDYAKEYMKEIEIYLRSPNRAHHYENIRVISDCKSIKEVEKLFVKV